MKLQKKDISFRISQFLMFFQLTNDFFNKSAYENSLHSWSLVTSRDSVKRTVGGSFSDVFSFSELFKVVKGSLLGSVIVCTSKIPHPKDFSPTKSCITVTNHHKLPPFCCILRHSTFDPGHWKNSLLSKVKQC